MHGVALVYQRMRHVRQRCACYACSMPVYVRVRGRQAERSVTASRIGIVLISNVWPVFSLRSESSTLWVWIIANCSTRGGSACRRGAYRSACRRGAYRHTIVRH